MTERLRLATRNEWSAFFFVYRLQHEAHKDKMSNLEIQILISLRLNTSITPQFDKIALLLTTVNLMLNFVIDFVISKIITTFAIHLRKKTIKM